MDAGVHSVTELLSAPGRLLIPVYQRPYVWTREDQWEPLWNDILWLLEGYLEGKPRRHFLGAIVLQQLKTMPGELPCREVIDGQQRMTTLQILLAACAASAGEMGAKGVQEVLGGFVRNSEHLASGDDVHKLWPTENDRHAFRLVMQPGGPPPDAKDDPTNSIQEAFAFFAEAAKTFAIEGGVDAAVIITRYEALRNVLMQYLQVVSINLQEGDDAQVIFETLNARGTPLLEIDNVKNALFHRAGLQGVDIQDLNDTVWQPELGDLYWREEVRQGRLVRPRAEMFLNHWLTMIARETIPATKLFQTFRGRVLEESPGTDAASVTRTLCEDAAIMRSFDALDPASIAGRYFRALDGADTTTVLPLTLLLFRLDGLGPERRDRALLALESYLVRRMLFGGTSRAYNRFFVDMLKPVAANPEVADDTILAALASSSAGSAVWPTDEQLRPHLLSHPLYNWIARARIEYVLWELELVLRGTAKTERIVDKPGRLSIEHILPQQWDKHWPMADSTDASVEVRNGLINVLGNLTLVTGELNSSLSNAGWHTKRERLTKSVLVLNGEVKGVQSWGEDAVLARGEALTEMVLLRWPGPAQLIPGFDASTLETVVEEIDPAKAAVSTDEMSLILAGASALLRALLEDLAARPDRRRRFVEVEDSLGWSRGRLASVLGGYSMTASARSGKRPYRIGRDEEGEFWMWVDAEHAASLTEGLRSEPC